MLVARNGCPLQHVGCIFVTQKKRERESIDHSYRSKALSYSGITVHERFLLFTKTNVMYRGVRANCLGLPYEKQVGVLAKSSVSVSRLEQMNSKKCE